MMSIKDFNIPRSANEFINDYEKYINNLISNGVNAEELAEKKALFCGYEFNSIKYEKYLEAEPEKYSKDNLLECSLYIDSIISEYKKRPYDRGLFFARISSFVFPMVLLACKDKYKDDNITFNVEDMAESFIMSTDKIFNYYLKDFKYPEPKDYIDIDKLIKKYPDSIVVFNKQTSEKLLKTYKNKSQNVALWDSEEKNFSIVKNITNINNNDSLNLYDVYVFESIMSLYDFGIKHISLPMIYKIMMGNANSRLSDRRIKDYKKHEIFQSIMKLIRFRCIDSSTGEFYQDYLLNGNIKVVKGRMILEISNESKFYLDAKKNNNIIKIKFEELKLNIQYDKIRIALKRYLMDKIFDAASTSKGVFKIRINDICNVTRLEDIKRESSFRSTQRDNSLLILQEFKNNGLIKSYKEDHKPWDIITIYL